MIFSFREHILKPLSRSSGWIPLRSEFLKVNPVCEICGRTNNLQVHHKKCVSDHPELELVKDNLVTLCDGPTKCHFVFGHLGNWKSINEDIENDVIIFKNKFKNRK